MNWDKIIYFVVLGTIIFFILKYAISNILYVEAPGQVYFSSVKVRLPEDVTLNKFQVLEGDTVNIGDTLFSYTPANNDDDGGGRGGNISISGLGSTSSSSKTWHLREVYQLQKKIELTNLKIIENNNLIKWNKVQLKELENQVILEVTSKTVVERFKNEINKLQQLNNKYYTEIGVFKRLIKQLETDGGETQQTTRKVNVTTNNVGNGGGSGSGGNSSGDLVYYKSPIKATITRIYKNDHEVSLKPEEILNLHKRERIYIKAFFDQEDYLHLQKGTEVDIIFPDGSETTGVISRFYFATYRIPIEFQKKYEPITRTVAVDIYPALDNDNDKWQAFYKMGVTIKASKF